MNATPRYMIGEGVSATFVYAIPEPLGTLDQTPRPEQIPNDAGNSAFLLRLRDQLMKIRALIAELESQQAYLPQLRQAEAALAEAMARRGT